MRSRFSFAMPVPVLLALLAAPAGLVAQEQNSQFNRYTVVDLGTLGGTYSYAYGLNDAGVVAGGSATSFQTGLSQTAFLWQAGHIIDLGTLGGTACPDCNSSAGGPNTSGISAVISETSALDPNGEDFCGGGTHRQCLGATWTKGVLKALLPFPGGNNSQAYWINNPGEVAGFAESGTLDSTCMTATPYQVLRFEAALWEPNGKIHELPPLPGDTVAFGFGINDEGQAVGASGLCSNTALPPFTNGPQAPHAMLWERDGTPVDLGGLVSGATINIATSINKHGEIVGGSQSSDGNPHAFLWTKSTGMQDLGALPGDFLSTAPCCRTINNRRQIVGFSIPGPLGSGRAFLWQNGVMTDLNTLIPAGSPWYLEQALSINDAGEIVGYGTVNGETHAFLARPLYNGGAPLVVVR